jgi:hypothetical protein
LRWAAAALAAALALAAAPDPAEAGPPGKWTQVTGKDGGTSDRDQIGLERTAEGVLHVLWTREASPGPGQVRHSAISASAKVVAGPDSVFEYPGGVNGSVELVAGPGGGLRAFFAGLAPGNAVTEHLATATAGPDGRSWTAPTLASNGTEVGGKPVYAALGIGAVIGLDGTAFSAWGDPMGGFHIGLSAGDPDQFIAEGSPVDPALAVDSTSGLVVLVWNSVTGNSALARPIAPPGDAVILPRSGSTQFGQRVSATGRIGADGIWAGYSSGTNLFLGKPALWRLGARRAKIVSNEPGARFTGVAAAPGGRLWVFWARDDVLFAARSNSAASRFGQVVSLEPPKGTTSVFSLSGEGSRGPLDLLVNVQRSAGTGFWHQRVLPGLTLTAQPTPGGFLFKVTDAGTPVSGATVRVGSVEAKTGKKGTVGFKLRAGRYRAIASKAFYAPASTRVRVGGGR